MKIMTRLDAFCSSIQLGDDRWSATTVAATQDRLTGASVIAGATTVGVFA